jgi:hypothetical protein
MKFSFRVISRSESAVPVLRSREGLADFDPNLKLHGLAKPSPRGTPSRAFASFVTGVTVVVGVGDGWQSAFPVAYQLVMKEVTKVTIFGQLNILWMRIHAGHAGYHSIPSGAISYRRLVLSLA